jgi:hypothetical protein
MAPAAHEWDVLIKERKRASFDIRAGRQTESTPGFSGRHSPTPTGALLLLVNFRTRPDSATPYPVLPDSTLESAATPIPRAGTEKDKTTRFVVIVPFLFRLEEKPCQ